MLTDKDTIAAIASPPGKGGVGIIRVSGEQVPELIGVLFNRLLKPRYAEYCNFRSANKTILDKVIALYFPAPASYTGEHVLEIHGHGGPVVLNLLLKRVLSLGCRPAKPGEFTERAFLNEKLDLTQAEAIIDLIDSRSEQAAKAAMRSLTGVFSEKINELLLALIGTRLYIEAALDFPQEEIDFLSDREVSEHMRQLQQKLASILAATRQGKLLKDGMTITIVGLPNVGKSSLLNRLAGTDTAIVTDIAGTTRDVLREHIHLDGVPLHIMDTAGLRQTQDVIEQEGVKRALAEAGKTDRILYVVDACKGVTKEDKENIGKFLPGIPVDIICNKQDLLETAPYIKTLQTGAEIGISAKTGAGFKLLTDHLKQSFGYSQSEETIFTARERHLQALQKAHQHIDWAEVQLKQGSGELAAEELRAAQEWLSMITGEFTSDDLLGEIFSNFCIGK